MNTPPNIPRIAIQSISGGLLLMAFFTMMWTGIAQPGLGGRDHRLVLIFFSSLCVLFIIFAVVFFIAAKKFPKTTTDEHEAEGKSMGKRFGIIFGIEGTAIPIASLILVWLGNDRFILSAIALIVGLHFYPMAKIFNRKIDYYLATWTCIIAITSISLILSGKLPEELIQSVLGIGVALATASYGIYMIIEGRRLTN